MTAVRAHGTRMAQPVPWSAGGRATGQRSRGGSTAAATPRARGSVVETARRAALARTLTARLRTVGVVPPGREGALDASLEARITARQHAQLMFDWDDPNMDQVGEILGSMITHLSPGMRWTAEASARGHCQSRDAYVMGHRPPVHLCPSFFTSGPEQQARTLIHESAHLSGIGQPDQESYCASFDCQTGCGGFGAADSWAHYVHCLSRQRPDRPTTITAPARPTQRTRP